MDRNGVLRWTATGFCGGPQKGYAVLNLCVFFRDFFRNGALRWSAMGHCGGPQWGFAVVRSGALRWSAVGLCGGPQELENQVDKAMGYVKTLTKVAYMECIATDKKNNFEAFAELVRLEIKMKQREQQRLEAMASEQPRLGRRFQL